MFVCVCGGENERGREEGMGEQDVVTETGGDLSASSKQRTVGHMYIHSCWAWTHKP